MYPYRAHVWLSLFLLSAALTGGGSLRASAQETPEADEDADPNWNVPTTTLGGKQFWADELIHGSWRIQKNVVYGHYRLLDPHNVRRAWGTWDECYRQWLELKKAENVPPLKPKVVLALHGLGRSRASMKKLVEYLSEHGDYDVLNVSYASTRVPLSADAKSLTSVVSHLENVTEINFVAHSMGNLVVRHFLHDQLAAARGLGVDPRFHRFVMLAPPNNGAALARRFRYDPTFRLVWGVGGQEFTKPWDEVAARLLVPPFEFGIVAGGSVEGKSGNPLLKGNDDLVVTVEETQLPGAADFVIVPAAHTFIMDDPHVQEYTLRFFQQGCFISDAARHRLEAAPTQSDHGP